MPILSLTEQTWTFRDAATRTWRAAQVPGCVHRDLRRHELIPDPFWGRNELDVQWVSDREWEYRCEFEVAAELLAQDRVDLCADGLDTLATVTLNGQVVLRSDNMFIGSRVAVTPALRRGRNELTIRFASATQFIAHERQEHQPREINDPVGGATRMRKQQCQFGWDWGPRLITAGIWRDLRLEAWSTARLADVRIRQAHRRNSVQLEIAAAIELPNGRQIALDSPGAQRLGLTLGGQIKFAGEQVASIVQPVGPQPNRVPSEATSSSKIENPQLWWPAGQGAQPLYDVHVELRRGDEVLDAWDRRIGLRTVVLERKRDAWGESFQFVVNGRPVFAKGGSWVPAHSLVGGLTRADYEPLLRSVAAANMNMVRVWGGGVYEHECFYDLCDELGLLVWHDFMFACTLYPGDAAFQRSVRAEAEYQVRRLRHRACLALWCGNNELELLNGPDLKKPRPRAAYNAIFRRILPDAVAAHDGVTPYWRSSPTQSEARGLQDPTKSGNTHFWDVWHLLKPVKSYEAQVFRFVAEFGMQSFPSETVARTFCSPDQLNIFSPVMENHQKNPMGNRIILEYVGRRYRFPKDYASLAYLSQLNQAYCMQVGVEHYRRHQPRCMGTLYWQLNDCWPVASWSSLEFGGRWKALHHVARRFYAPYLISAHVPGDETVAIGNRTKSTVREVHLHTICDAPTATRGVVEWELFGLDGDLPLRGKKRVELRPGESRRQQTLDLARPIEKFGRERLYLRIALTVDGQCVSEDTVFLYPPRALELARAQPSLRCRKESPHAWRIELVSPVFQHRVALDFGAREVAELSDNWFELYPARPKSVRVVFAEPIDERELRRALEPRSLVDSYA
ncbi:MAG TPA: glycoside hydrolase family 2 protein [Acidobacteriota bacterium]|nr:glycoside hydrolase family 2 protein [Acidobacteriota bacterium]